MTERPEYLTLAQLELLHDKVDLWRRATVEGAMDSRDYYRRAADALEACLAIVEGPLK